MRTITIKLADGRTITKRVDERGIVPNGGTAGQSLIKTASDDYAVDWGDAIGDNLLAEQGVSISEVGSPPVHVIKLGGEISEIINIALTLGASLAIGEADNVAMTIARTNDVNTFSINVKAGANTGVFNVGTDLNGKALMYGSFHLEEGSPVTEQNCGFQFDEDGFKYTGDTAAAIAFRNSANDLWLVHKAYVDGVADDLTTALTVVQATEIIAGKAELATTAETLAGTDDERIVTPLKLKAKIEDLTTDWDNPHGFVFYDNTETTLSFVEGTRTVTITPAVVSPVVNTISYYIDGIKYTVTGAKSVIFPDTEGTHFIYFNTAGDLLSTQTFATAGAGAFVAALYWDATNNLIIYQANERHTTAFSHADWMYKHLSFGTQYRSGASLSAITADGDGDLDASASFTADAGVIDDEDIRHVLAQQTTFDIFYRLGASGDWRRSDIGTAYGVHYNATRATYNQFTGGAWQLTTVSNLNFVLAHVFATNNLLSPYIVIMGQALYTTIGGARTGATVEMNNLITAGLPFQEFVPVASIIYQTADAYDNAVRSRIRTTDTGGNYVNWLGQELSPTVNPTSHNNLLDLQGGTAGQYYHTTADQNAAITGAASPSAANVFATMADVGGGGGGETYTGGDGITVVAGSPDNIINLGGECSESVEVYGAQDKSIYIGRSIAGHAHLYQYKTSTNSVIAMRYDIGSNFALSSIISDALVTKAHIYNLVDEGANACNIDHTADGLEYGSATAAEMITRGGTVGDNWIPNKKYVDDSSGGGLTLANGTNNYLVTATGAAALNGEANLNFDGSVLGIFRAANETLPALGSDGGRVKIIKEAVAGDKDGYGLIIGVLSTGDVYMQAQRTDGTATAYNIQINPNGGAALFDNGAEALPSISFNGDVNTGFWAQAADVIGVSLGGDEKYRFTGGNFHCAADGVFSSTTTPSDRRLKAKIRPLRSALEKVMQLAGVSFYLRKDKEKRRKFGLIAQDVQAVCPEVVKEVEMLDGKKRLTVDYQALVPVLIEAIKEQQKQIDELKERLK